MLPIPKPSSSPEPQLRKPKTPPDLQRTTSFNSLHSFLLSSAHHPGFNHTRTCLLLSILSLHILLLLTLPISSPFYRRRHHFPFPVSSPSSSSSSSSSNPTTTDQCRFGKIYVYDLPSSLNTDLLKEYYPALSNDGFGPPATSLPSTVPAELGKSWHETDQFASEVIFHNRILKHKCRTWHPENATAFYVPLYAGLAIGKLLFQKETTSEERDKHCLETLTFLESQPHFSKSKGWDHFLTMGRISWDFRRSKDQDWGSSCIYQPLMRNITRLLIERNPWDYFDVGVPYPTGFHPNTDSDVLRWQEFVRSKPRKTLFSFAGATRANIKNDFRGILLRHCKSESGGGGGLCQVVDCSVAGKCSNGSSSAVLEAFLDSEFCLQPRGDSFTRKSVFDCMVAGAIPVVFWRRSVYYQYEWFLPAGEPESFSVFIHRDGVKNGTVNVREVLGRFKKEEVERMRSKVVEYIPRIVYARRMEGLETVRDAFDVAVDGVLRRFKEHEQWDYKW